MFLRQAMTAFLVLTVLGTGHPSNSLAKMLGRADFGISRKIDDRSRMVLHA
ncbi:hypothetical protein [Enterovirga sp.]|uniref:hypothetical protein n=1 Tax=Enterovirga sp. TaxID=2026350 RepID=UPI002C04658B|nr:hypothetical protein [Enterovirga sp.]HMO31122.1 hypothetical protein [Enterovirga sp.]